MRKLKLLLSGLAFLVGGILPANAWTDVTSTYLTDAALEDESANWALVNGANNHNWNSEFKYHESWHNTFTITQTATVPNGYYQISIQAVNSTIPSNNVKLTATSGDNSATAYIRHSSAGSFAEISGWLRGNPLACRIYATLKVDNGSLTIKFSQPNNNEWIVYGDFKLYSLTEDEYKKAIILQTAIESNTNGWSNGWTNGGGQYSFGRERFNDTAYEPGKILYKTFSNLPKGKYDVTVMARANVAWRTAATGDNIAEVYANDGKYSLTVNAETGFTPSPDQHYYKFENNLVSDGNLEIGLRNIGTGGNWYVISLVDLKLVDPYLSAYATEIPAATATALTAGAWYKFTPAKTGDHAFAATTLGNIAYTTDDQLLSTAAASATVTSMMELTAGTTYYLKSSSAQTLTITPQIFSYTVGEATTDKNYIQTGDIVTVTFADLSTDNPNAALTANLSGVTFGGSSVNCTATENGKGFTFTVPTVTAAKEYTLAIPANTIGYAVGNTYNAAQQITLTTPAVLDGTYFIKTSGNKYLSRGGSYNTQAIVDNWGLPVKVSTNSSNVTEFVFVDNNFHLFDANNGNLYTDNNTANNFEVEATTGGYFIINKNTTDTEGGKVYIDSSDGNRVKVSKSESTVWTFETPAAHKTQMQAVKDAQALAVAGDASISASTVDALSSILESDYVGINVSITGTGGTIKESYQQGASNQTGNELKIFEETIEGLTPGLYCLTVTAFERITWPDDVYNYAGGAPGLTYVYANDQKVQLWSLFDFPSNSEWDGGKDKTYDEKYYANNTTGANAAFTAGNYINKVFVNVIDEGNGTGSIHFGINKPHRYANDGNRGAWVCYNNFTLTHYKLALPTQDMMDPSLATAQALVADPYKTEGKQALNEAIAAALISYNNISSYTYWGFDAEVKKLETAIETFKKANRIVKEGKFYVQHAASDKFISAGHDYGTHGIVDEVGLDLTLATHNATDRTVSFDTQVFNDKKHFLGSNLYMDSDVFGWIIEKTGDDTYSISNGTQYVGVDAKDNLAWVDTPENWKFVSAEALYAARMATLSEASEKNPVDATFLLKNPNFNRNDKRVSAWTVSEDCTNKNLNGGNQVNNCAESYHSTFTISQTVDGAPAGLYKMEAQGFYRQDKDDNDKEITEDNPVFFITDGTHEDTKMVPVKTGEEDNMADASASFTEGNYWCNPLECKITGKLEVGVRGTATHQWVIFDNFRLTYLGPIPADPTLMDPVMATAKKMAADPYKTEGKETLQEAITAAQTAVAYSASYNYTEFEAEVKKLQAAVDAFAKANRIVKEGTFYVQHVNSGKYMAAGHNWGTRAIVNETGLDLTLAANADNTVTVETQVSNGGAQHFLGDGLYMDQNSFGWWIGKYEDGTFSLSNGTKYVDVDDEGNLVFVDNPVGWQFITPENWQKGQLAKLDAATPENGVDATWMLKNPNFNRNDQRVSAWTTSGSNINLNDGENNSGTNMNNCGEAYHSKFTVSQKVEGARSGIYVLEVQGFYRQDGDAAESTPEFFIKDNTKNVENDSVKMAVTVSEEYKALGEGSMSSASELFSEGKYDHKLAQCKIKGDFTVGVRTKGENQWVIFDNFRLTYYGPIPAELGQMEPVLAEAKKLAADKMKTEGKDALNAAITAAEASAANYATLTYDQFEKEVDKLKTAIEAFKKANRKRMTGVYYVQNVASGKFMSAGHNWGTQAIVDEVGLDMTLKANSKDNKVSFDSQVSNGGNNHFLNSGLYMDGTSFDWSIEKMGDNVYSISDGTKFINVDENDNLVMSEEPAAWRFVTLEERVATLEDASEDDGVDATFLVKDYNLGRNNQRVSGWAVSDDCNKNFMTLGGPADKNIANYSGETWHTTFTISQTLNEMPLGLYGLTAQGFYRQDGEVAEAAPVFFINEERKELPVLAGETGNMEGAAIALGNGEYAMEEPILCTVKDGQITFGVNGIASSQWVSFDNFRLIYYGLSGEDVTNPPVAKKELVYTGKSQVLIEAGSHEVGEIQYSLDKENFSTELPQATNAGSYSIWYRVVDENNEPLLSVKKITANIAPVNATDYISMELADAGTTYTYDATAKEPEVIVKGGIKGLTAGTDYVVTYEDNVNAGTAKAILTGLGNYKGTIVAPFEIEKAEMTLLVLADTILVYNEEEQTVELDSVMAGEVMIPADAYTVEGNVQSAVGRYTVVVTANEESNFVGELTAEFEIIGRDIAGCEMTLKSYKEYFTGYERKPAVVVTRGEIELTEGVDYIVSYENNINAGTALAIVTGIGNYSGTNEQEFTIVTGDGQLTMLNDTVTISYITTGFSVRPIKLTGDGNLTYTSSNEEVAQVNYKTGEITINNVGETIITAIMKNTKNATSDTITCLLVVKPASEWQVTAIRTSSIYELPAFRVTSAKETLVEGRDYTMSYKNLEGREVTEAEMVAESGMYTAVVNLKGNYTGTIERDILVQITATDIDGVKSDLNGKIRYDMSGRRVKNYRGIVIEDGQVRAVKK